MDWTLDSEEAGDILIFWWYADGFELNLHVGLNFWVIFYWKPVGNRDRYDTVINDELCLLDGYFRLSDCSCTLNNVFSSFMNLHFEFFDIDSLLSWLMTIQWAIGNFDIHVGLGLELTLNDTELKRCIFRLLKEEPCLFVAIVKHLKHFLLLKGYIIFIKIKDKGSRRQFQINQSNHSQYFNFKNMLLINNIIQRKLQLPQLRWM